MVIQMNEEKKPQSIQVDNAQQITKPYPKQRYANNGMSDKAFKNMIVCGGMFAVLFLIGLYFAVLADK